MEDLHTQLLIIGGGASGMAAAAAAAERGIQVTVAEAGKTVGGNGLFPRGVFAIDSVLQRRKLVLADKDEIFRDCMNYSHWKIDGRIIRTLIDKSGDTISWLMDKGVEFIDVVHHIPNQTPEVFHITSPDKNAGSAVIEALKAYCETENVTILTKTKGSRLLKDADGSVCGAVCLDGEGNEVTIIADKVIICTGGFSGNKEMIRRFYPNVPFEYIAEGGGMRHPGDGVRMALEAGADIEGNFAIEMAAPKIQGYGPLNLLLGKPYNVWVNRFGQRFADEGIVYNFAQAANACLRQPKGRMWVLFNQAMVDQTLNDGRDLIELIHIPASAEEQLPATIDAAIRGGIMCKAETIAELADFIGCDASVLENEIASYDGYCASGRDGIFAKNHRYLQMLGKGPIYAVKAGTDMLITHGGVRVDASFKALDADFMPIGNLFTAGVDFGGADADVYNVMMSGHGFGFALNSGRIAGECAAAEIIGK